MSIFSEARNQKSEIGKKRAEVEWESNLRDYFYWITNTFVYLDLEIIYVIV